MSGRRGRRGMFTALGQHKPKVFVWDGDTDTSIFSAPIPTRAVGCVGEGARCHERSQHVSLHDENLCCDVAAVPIYVSPYGKAL